jgi:hypothetical protein
LDDVCVGLPGEESVVHGRFLVIGNYVGRKLIGPMLFFTLA